MLCSVTESCQTLCDSTRLLCPWGFSRQNTGVGCHALFQGWNPGLPHCRGILYQLSHKESQRILEWVAYPFSTGSSQPRNRTGVTCIAGEFFTSWATRETILESCLLFIFRCLKLIPVIVFFSWELVTLCFSFIYQKNWVLLWRLWKKNLDSVIFQWGVLNFFVLSGN